MRARNHAKLIMQMPHKKWRISRSHCQLNPITNNHIGPMIAHWTATTRSVFGRTMLSANSLQSTAIRLVSTTRKLPPARRNSSQLEIHEVQPAHTVAEFRHRASRIFPDTARCQLIDEIHDARPAWQAQRRRIARGSLDLRCGRGRSVSGEGRVQCGTVFSDQLTHGIGTICAGLEPVHETAHHGAANNYAIGNRAGFDRLLGAANTHADQNRKVGVFLGASSDLDR